MMFVSCFMWTKTCRNSPENHAKRRIGLDLGLTEGLHQAQKLAMKVAMAVGRGPRVRMVKFSPRRSVGSAPHVVGISITRAFLSWTTAKTTHSLNDVDVDMQVASYISLPRTSGHSVHFSITQSSHPRTKHAYLY